MSLIGDIGDPKKDVEALKPLVDEAIDRAAAGLKNALTEALDGLTVTITIKKKESL